MELGRVRVRVKVKVRVRVRVRVMDGVRVRVRVRLDFCRGSICLLNLMYTCMYLCCFNIIRKG